MFSLNPLCSQACQVYSLIWLGYSFIPKGIYDWYISFHPYYDCFDDQRYNEVDDVELLVHYVGRNANEVVGDVNA